MRIENKLFVVTGGGNGIGREVVLALLARGARVAALDLREAALAETTALAGTSATGRLTAYPVDVADRAAVGAVFERIAADQGPIDGLLNVAGIIQPFVPIAELSIEDMERVLNVNFWGVVNTTKAALPQLISRPEACVVNVSSIGGFCPVPGQSAYGASKAAVKLFTEGLYAELRGGPVDVTVVFPGAIRTGISDNSGVSVPGAEGAAPEAGGFPMTEPAEAARQILDAITKPRSFMTMAVAGSGPCDQMRSCLK